MFSLSVLFVFIEVSLAFVHNLPLLFAHIICCVKAKLRFFLRIRAFVLG